MQGDQPAVCRLKLFLLGIGLLWAVNAQAQRPDTWMPIGPANGTIFTFRGDPFDSRVLYAGTYFGGMYRSVDRGLSWIPVPSPFSSYSVFSIACDPNRMGTLYVGTFQHGVFKSEDGGLTWQERNTGIQDLNIQDIGVDPFDSSHLIVSGGVEAYGSSDGGRSWQVMPAENIQPGKVVLFDPAQRGLAYIGTFGHGVIRSTDGGASFSPFNAGMGEESVLAISRDPVDGALYAAASDGAFRLPPGATVWESISRNLPPGEFNQVIPHPLGAGMIMAATRSGVFERNLAAGTDWSLLVATQARLLYSAPPVIFLAAEHAGLYLSADNGRTFEPRFQGIQNLFVEEMAAVAAGGKTYLFSGTDIGVFQMSADLAGWKRNPDFDQTIFEIKPHPAEPQTLFVGTERNGVYKTNNFGLDWVQMSDGLLPSRILTMSQSPFLGNTLYAGTTAGIYVSRDNAKRWLQVTPLSGVYSIAFDPHRPGTAYFGANRGQFYKTSNDGYSIEPLATNLPPQDIIGLAMGAEDHLYALQANGKLTLTLDGGTTWAPVASEIPEKGLAMAAAASDSATVYVGTNGAGVYKSVNAGIDWTAANTDLGNPFVFSLFVDPQNPDTIYAGTGDGVYRSDDGAATWRPASVGLPSGFVIKVLGGPAGSGLLFALSGSREVYRSVVGGDSWERVASDLPNAVDTLAANPTTSGIIYAGAGPQGVFTSEDAGMNWAESSKGMSLFIRALAFDTRDPNIMYAGSLSAGMFKTTNGGQRWKSIGLTDRNVFKIAIDPLNSQVLYAGTTLGITKTEDGGASWKDLGQKVAFIFCMAVDQRNPDTIYLGTVNGTVYRSTDGGRTWESRSSGLPQANIIALATAPNSDTIYAGADRVGIFKSTDGGLTWRQTAPIPGFRVSEITSILVAPDSSAVYAAGIDVGIFQSTDGGDSWQNAIAGITTLSVRRLAADPTRPSRLYACTVGEGVFKSIDAGASWTAAYQGIGRRSVSAVAVDPRNPDILYAGTQDGLFKSGDGALHWERLVTGLPDEGFTAVAADPGQQGVVYAVGMGGGLFLSADSGATWQRAPLPFVSAVPRAVSTGSAPGIIYIATLGEGFSRSADAGATWSAPAALAIVSPVTMVIAVDPRNSSTVYAGTAGGGILRSTDGGLEWKPVSKGLDQLFILSLAIDPVDTNTVYAGSSQGGVFVTSDRGETWSPLRNGLYNLNVPSVLVDPVNHKIVYAGTEGGGVFRLLRP